MRLTSDFKVDLHNAVCLTVYIKWTQQTRQGKKKLLCSFQDQSTPVISLPPNIKIQSVQFRNELPHHYQPANMKSQLAQLKNELPHHYTPNMKSQSAQLKTELPHHYL